MTRAGGQQALQRALQCVGAGFLGTSHKQRGLGAMSEQRRVGKAKHGRTVEHDHVETLAHERNKIETQQIRRRARGETDIAAAAQNPNTDVEMSEYDILVSRDPFFVHAGVRQLLVEKNPRARSTLAVDKSHLRAG